VASRVVAPGKVATRAVVTTDERHDHNQHYNDDGDDA
jgi:hypothetical protein